MKKPPISLLVALLCLTLAYSWFYWYPQRKATEAFRQALPNYVEEQLAYPQELLADTNFLNYFLVRDELRYLKEVKTVVQDLERLEEEGVGLFLLDSTRVVLSTALVDWRPDDLPTVLLEGQFLFGTPTELWSVQVQQLRENVLALIFIPLHKAPFAEYVSLQAEIGLGGMSVQLDERLFRIESKEALPRSPLLYLLFVLGSLLAWWSAHRHVIHLRHSGKIYRAAGWGLGTAGLLIWWFQSSIWPDHWKVLQAIWETSLLPSTLLGLFGQVLVALWLFRLFYLLYSGEASFDANPRRWLFLPLLYGVGLVSLLGVAYWLKSVILDSQVFFNLDQVLELGLPGGMVALSLITFLMAVFLLVKCLSMVVRQWSVPLNYRLLGMLSGIILSYVLLIPFDLGISIWIWSLLAFIFLLLIDLQLDSGAFSLTWLMVWLILLSTFSASFTYKFSLEKELLLMKQQRAQMLTELSQKGEMARAWQEEGRYSFLHLQYGGIFEGNGFVSALDWEAIQTLSPDTDYSSITNQMVQVAGRQGEDTIVLQKELGSYFRPLSLFALYFSMFLLVLLGLVLLHYRLPVLPDFLLPVFKTRNSLRNRIQFAVIGIILLSSVVIALVTIWYFRDTAARTQERQVLEQFQQIEQALNTNDTAEAIDWKQLQDKLATPFALYDIDGARLYEPTGLAHLPYWLPASTLEQLRLALIPFEVRSSSDHNQRLAFAPIQAVDGQIKAYAGLPFSRFSEERTREINNFVGSVFSLYVFFMFVAGGIAIWVANSITEPISQIGEGLRNLRLGGNVPLSWKNRDEIGLLVEEYNAALSKLEDSTRQLRKAEREGAWRDMAQQVAHEIKNPLTPMKLSVQHLLRSYQADPEAIGPMLKRMSTTLIEQIGGLTKIANEFSHFAKMPEAQLERFNINDLLHSVVDLFVHQKNKVRLDLELPGEPCFAMIDKDQLLRVFNNLLTNAVQAIPDDRPGEILIRLKQLSGRLLIEVRDNGKGIPAPLQEKVFYPYFTTKSSGTGIGLSMCRNIIEQFGGRIYFETKEGKGTSFYVELQAAHQ